MPDIVKEVTNAPAAAIATAKRNPWAIGLIVLVVLVLVLRMSSKWQAGIAAKDAAAGGKGLWHTIGRVTGALAVAVICVLAAGSADAATLAAPVAIDAGVWSEIGRWAAASAMLATVAFPAPDFCSLKGADDNFEQIITPTTTPVEKRFTFKAERETFSGFPLKATDVQFQIKALLTQAGGSGDVPILWDELFRITDGLEVTSPRFGTLVDKESMTGPVLKHMYEFIANAYCYSGDSIFATIAPSDSGYSIEIYQSYPIMQRYLAKPDETAMFVGWLQNSLWKYRLAPATAIAMASPSATIAGQDVRVRCGFRYIVGAVQNDIRDAYQVPALACARVLRTPASGQTDLSFKEIGATGPENTDVTYGERLVAAVLLSGNLGLGGIGTFSDVTELGCETLGQLPTECPEMWMLAKLPADRPREPPQVLNPLIGVPPIAIQDTIRQRGWPYMLESDPTYVNNHGTVMTFSLMGLPFALPSVGEKITKLLRVKGDISLHVRKTVPPAPGGECKLFLLTLRDIAPGYAATMLSQAGISGTTRRAGVADSNAAIRGGKASPRQYVGLPQVAK